MTTKTREEQLSSLATRNCRRTVVTRRRQTDTLSMASSSMRSRCSSVSASASPYCDRTRRDSTSSDAMNASNTSNNCHKVLTATQPPYLLHKRLIVVVQFPHLDLLFIYCRSHCIVLRQSWTFRDHFATRCDTLRCTATCLRLCDRLRRSAIVSDFLRPYETRVDIQRRSETHCNYPRHSTTVCDVPRPYETRVDGKRRRWSRTFADNCDVGRCRSLLRRRRTSARSAGVPGVTHDQARVVVIGRNQHKVTLIMIIDRSN